ncbi:MAG: hypothetical protein JWM95_1090 [Gemmatimonadetes bacterium]|nr:hypothetical protein [Gemmatimonadota bacterium]
MAQIYALSRSGGPASERFTAYVARVEHEYGLVGYNPMAGPHALEAVQQLLALDAEAIAFEAASEVAARCGYGDAIMLAIVLASPGMWTDRLSTEVQHRTVAKRTAGRGFIYQWTREQFDAPSVRRESAAEAVRVMWTATHGAARTVRAVLAREGLAYALSSNPYGDATPDDTARVEEALAVLGESTELSDIAGVLYGDPACDAHGWPLLGIPEYAGYRYAIKRAAADPASRSAVVKIQSCY